jgi:hypothetical protein
MWINLNFVLKSNTTIYLIENLIAFKVFNTMGFFYDASKLLKLVPTYCLRPSFSSFLHSKQPNSIANNAQVK